LIPETSTGSFAPASAAATPNADDQDANDEDSDDENSDDEPDADDLPGGHDEGLQGPAFRTGLPRAGSYTGGNGNLQRLLFDELSKTRGGGLNEDTRGFIPRKRLNDLINPESVQEQLLHHESSVKAKSVNWLKGVFTSPESGPVRRDARRICGLPSTSPLQLFFFTPPKCYIKIFAILMLIRKPGRISRFLEEEIWDADLPLVKLQRRKRAKPFTLVRRSNTSKKLNCFKGWKFATIMEFWDKQWCVLAPTFTGCPNTSKLKPLPLEDGTMLPFHNCKHIFSTTSADVYQVNIHPEHHYFCDEKEASGHSVFRYVVRICY
jgi:hypothetical protein